ncbi:uncharacterized protein [Typha angustifolia]|uniref:uncharacterized protein n=1 Tax=Typha angustifolia TaxID=59011 RepID=UPI003C2DCFF6
MEEAKPSSPKSYSPVEGGEEGQMPEYERQRLLRIRENKARMEALGLPHLASSLLGPLAEQEKGDKLSKLKKNKRGRVSKLGEEDDEEYRPSDDDDEEEAGGSSPPSGKEEKGEKVSSGSRRKGKKKNVSNLGKACKSSYVKAKSNVSDCIDDDAALEQAIALSLGVPMEDSLALHDGLSSSGIKETETGRYKKKDNAQEPSARRKTKQRKSGIQLTEDEVLAFFFSFDEVGKGYVTVRDIQRMAVAHDFSWTDSEIANMIHSFNSGGDGKLSLDDFRSIVSRCNMMQELGE